MKIEKEIIIHKGNESIAAGVLYGVSSLVITCPLCVVASSGLILNGVRQKLDIGLPFRK
ncbi:MAG: hypothetical protein ACXAEU_26190 [Candidatus Hodarchaeales archaeon]